MPIEFIAQQYDRSSHKMNWPYVRNYAYWAADWIIAEEIWKIEILTLPDVVACDLPDLFDAI